MSEVALLTLLDHFKFRSLMVESHEEVLINKGDGPFYQYPIIFNGEELGLLQTDANEEDSKELAKQIAPLLYLHFKGELWEESIELMTWVKGAKNLVPEVTDWIGIYYKASAILGKDTTDLFLGPFYGESTDHEVIPLDKGLCGLALREERIVNVANIHEDERHIACSLKTNSELIIPLINSEGEMVAELDIDCNRLGAFTPEVEKKFQDYAKSFTDLSKRFRKKS